MSDVPHWPHDCGVVAATRAPAPHGGRFQAAQAPRSLCDPTCRRSSSQRRAECTGAGVRPPVRRGVSAAFSAAFLPFVGGIVPPERHIRRAGVVGYGQLSDLFTLAHVAGNVRRYPAWLVETQTPFVLLAGRAVVHKRSARRRPSGACWLRALTFACYVPHGCGRLAVSRSASCLPVMIGLSAPCRAAADRAPDAWRAAGLLSAWLTGAFSADHVSRSRAVFRLKDPRSLSTRRRARAPTSRQRGDLPRSKAAA